MNSGPSGAIQFQINKNTGGPGIFWQKDKLKNEPRKFGYKSKQLRHPIRKPDEEAVLIEMENAKEEEKKKFNKSNKDFIRKNRNRFHAKEHDQPPPPGTTQIKPGTVTLTQEQLVALLASLGKTADKGGKENPLKISIDAKTNKIEVEKYESDDSGEDVDIDRYNSKPRGRSGKVNDDDDDSDAGIGAFLNGSAGDRKKKSQKSREDDRKTRNRRKNGEERVSRDEPRPQKSNLEPAQVTLKPDPPAPTRLSWDNAKKEAGVAHVPDTVPWKHLTVGERKRLQWAREKAEVEEEYNPWGRPGAGAPVRKGEENNTPSAAAPPSNAGNNQHWMQNTTRSNAASEANRKKEELALEIIQLQKEIRDAERRKEEREEKRESAVKESRREKESEKQDEEAEKRGRGRERKKRGQREAEERRREEDKDQQAEEQVQIVIVKKKRDKQTKKETEEAERDEHVEGGDGERKGKSRKESGRDGADSEAGGRTRDNSGSQERKTQAVERNQVPVPTIEVTSSLAASTRVNRNAQSDEMSGLTKKEMERRKWLAELDKQREEQRMRKQKEREMDRAGVHDQWADRFVYHKSSEQISPRQAKVQQNTTEPAPVLGRAVETVEDTHVPPAAMRSSMVVGAGTLNNNRFENKKAEEKRKWLEELDRQREEQRLAKVAQKQRDRDEDGTWADRYPTDHQKLVRPNEPVQYPTAPAAPTVQRISSAPQSTVPPVVDPDSDEAPTFLRGQGAFVDPVTRKEQEEKRRVHLEYQAQVKAQIEEKERRKREERERKIREDMEEERKLQAERDKLNQQQEFEQRKIREREESRQKQIAVLKSAMDEAQEKAAEEKNLRRMHHLQQRGHDISQLKATYDEPVSRMSMRPESRQLPGEANAEPTENDQPEAASEVEIAKSVTPRIKDYHISAIPGLGTDRDPLDHKSHNPMQATSPERARDRHVTKHEPNYYSDQVHVQQSYTKEPYVEDRVLTPSRFRNPSRPRDNPDSPRREFGTQTLELKDLQKLLENLPDEVQIEYKMRVEEALKEKEKEKTKQAPARKVHVKSADISQRQAGKSAKQTQPKERPAKLNERPQWNQRKRKTALKKNSEKDPFYQQRKEEAELRRDKRERQLLYLQELNKGRIPALSKSPGRSRDASPEGVKPVGERGRKPRPAGQVQSGKVVKATKERDSSPNILSLMNETDRGHKSRSPQTTGRSSPPIPAVRHRAAVESDTDRDPYHYTNTYLRSSQTDSKYGDCALVPTGDEFLPFMRTTEILDPSKADEPVAISRENSRMERARRAYHETHNPANKGRKLDVYQDREREAALKAPQNPLLNPGLVTDHPTARQDMILQQLSSLKKTLMQRQKELEDHMSSTDFQEETTLA